jgi:hypothetical protein
MKENLCPATLDPAILKGGNRNKGTIHLIYTPGIASGLKKQVRGGFRILTKKNRMKHK